MSTLARFIRKKLPDHRALRKWYESIDGSPGCTSEAIPAIKIKTEEAKHMNKTVFVNLVMDEISIRKHIEYDIKKTKILKFC